MPHNTQEKLLVSNLDLADILHEVLSKGLNFKFTATGMSMSPFISDGDILEIAPPSDSRAFQIGDVVAFTDPSTQKLIIHRIIKKKKGLFLLKGDNIFQNDGYFEKKNIHGCVKNVRKLKKNSLFMHQFTEDLLQFPNQSAKILAFLSHYKILTFFCRLYNKLCH